MYLIDTNVMLAASAVYNELSNLADEAEPKDAELREIVYRWLREFEKADHFIVLDEESLIQDEYKRNMPFNTNMQEQEYGFQVLQSKHDRVLVEYVPVNVDEGNGERIAILSDELTIIVTDREDRKWVAAAQSAQLLLSTSCPIVYGAESDWHLNVIYLRTKNNLTYCNYNMFMLYIAIQFRYSNPIPKRRTAWLIFLKKIIKLA